MGADPGIAGLSRWVVTAPYTDRNCHRNRILTIIVSRRLSEDIVALCRLGALNVDHFAFR